MDLSRPWAHGRDTQQLMQIFLCRHACQHGIAGHETSTFGVAKDTMQQLTVKRSRIVQCCADNRSWIRKNAACWVHEVAGVTKLDLIVYLEVWEHRIILGLMVKGCRGRKQALDRIRVCNSNFLQEEINLLWLVYLHWSISTMREIRYQAPVRDIERINVLFRGEVSEKCDNKRRGSAKDEEVVDTNGKKNEVVANELVV